MTIHFPRFVWALYLLLLFFIILQNIESLSLADSKLKYNVESVINAVGSNGSLTELDIR